MSTYELKCIQQNVIVHCFWLKSRNLEEETECGVLSRTLGILRPPPDILLHIHKKCYVPLCAFNDGTYYLYTTT